jgi:hypothetical protein
MATIPTSTVEQPKFSVQPIERACQKESKRKRQNCNLLRGKTRNAQAGVNVVICLDQPTAVNNNRLN